MNENTAVGWSRLAEERIERIFAGERIGGERIDAAWAEARAAAAAAASKSSDDDLAMATAILNLYADAEKKDLAEGAVLTIRPLKQRDLSAVKVNTDDWRRLLKMWPEAEASAEPRNSVPVAPVTTERRLRI